jgi:Arc/MetJ-type ribon-helix-helix transcriptional regulator
MTDVQTIFAFKCSKALHDAMTAAARADYISRSDVVRQALIKMLSERGLMAKDVQAA